jgi:hypothetical protein
MVRQLPYWFLFASSNNALWDTLQVAVATSIQQLSIVQLRYGFLPQVRGKIGLKANVTSPRWAACGSADAVSALKRGELYCS